MGKKVLIIGLDGFTWTIGRKLIQAGQMPNLSKLIDNGCHGNLESVIPYETSPAWTSFQTGCYPAKTGIFAFHGYSRKTHQIKLNSYHEIQTPTIWELLSSAGRKVVSINMPMTSPPPRINGVIIPGLTCPKIARSTVYPPEIYEKYIKPCPNYRIVNKEKQPKLSDYVQQTIKIEDARCSVALELMNDINWDVFSVQIQSTDAFQHGNWWALDSDAQGYTEADYLQASVLYHRIDHIVGKLIDAAGDSVLTIVVSDHGFCAKRADIGINTWLSQNGYLVFHDTKQRNPALLKEKLKRNVPFLKTMARFYGKAVTSFGLLWNKDKQHHGLYSEKVVKHIRETIDLDQSLAFCLGGMAGSLYVIDSSRTQEVNEMIAGLLADYGPNASEPLIASIEPNEMPSNSETSISSCPDFMIHLMPGVEARINPAESQVVKTGIIGGKQSGTHERDGIFVLHGPQVKPEQRFRANIVDIVPTILSYLGIPVPDHLDGKILEHAFTGELKVRYETSEDFQKERTDYSNPDQAAVEKQLKDLGYL